MKLEEIIPTHWINTAGSALVRLLETEIFEKRQSTDSETTMGLMHLWMSVTSSSEIPTARSAGLGKKSSVMVNIVTKATWLQTECIRQPHEKALNYWWREVIPGSWKWRSQHVSSLQNIPKTFLTTVASDYKSRICFFLIPRTLPQNPTEILQPFIWENNLQSEHQPSHNLFFSSFLNLLLFQGCFSFCSRDKTDRVYFPFIWILHYHPPLDPLPLSAPAIIISQILPGGTIRSLKQTSSIMQALTSTQLPMLKPIYFSEMKAKD